MNQTLNPSKVDHPSTVKYGTLTATLDNKTFNSLLDPGLKPSKRLEKILVKQGNEAKQNIQHHKKLSGQKYQPRYLKNTDLPISSSYINMMRDK